MYSIQESQTHENVLSENDYTVELDRVQKAEWDSIVKSFRDAVISQTWAWGKTKYREKQLSHLVLKRQSLIVSAAQLRVPRIPLLQIGASSVMRGPMWKPVVGRSELRDFRTFIRYLKYEFAEKRSLCLRMAHSWNHPDNEVLTAVLIAEGFRICWYRQSYRTLILDLSPSIEEL